MNQRHFNALLALEFKRARPLLTRLGAATPVAVGLFVVSGLGSAENLLAVVLGAGLGGAAVGVPITVMRDKLDGTLEFLVALPTPAATLAAAKFAAAAPLSLPWAVTAALVVSVVPLSLPLAGGPVGVASGVLMASWGGLATLSWVATAAWGRFDPKRVGLLPLAVIVILALLGSLIGRLMRAAGVDDPPAAITHLLKAPWLPLAMVGLGALLFVGLGWLSFAVAPRVSALSTHDRGDLRASVAGQGSAAHLLHRAQGYPGSRVRCCNRGEGEG